MATQLFEHILSFIENKLSLLLSTYPKYPNKLQVSALIIYFNSHPFIPTAPISWNSKKRALVTLDSKLRTNFYLLWVFLFDFLIGVASPFVLLFLEFGSLDGKETRYKMGMKISTFQMLFITGTFPSVCFAIFLWAMKADDVNYDYIETGKFANYLDHVHKLSFKRKLSRKVDIMGIMTHFNGQGFILAAYFVPLMALYFKMDPLWHIFHRIFPSCIQNSGEVLGKNYCKALFYGARPGLVYAWINNAGRSMGGSIMFAWIFFEMFNQCSAMLKALKPELGIHFYWTFWKVAAGPRYWSRSSLAFGIYGGIWLVTVCLYASIVVIPNADPLTFVYITFPMCCIVAIAGFICLPYALKFPAETRNLMKKWRYAAGISENIFKGKVVRREVRAMQPVTVRVGNYFNLDKSIVVVVITAIVDETVNLVVSMNTL